MQSHGNYSGWHAGKLAPNWEGPYRVIAIAGARAYSLKDMEERLLPWPWYVHNLKNFYHCLYKVCVMYSEMKLFMRYCK